LVCLLALSSSAFGGPGKLKKKTTYLQSFCNYILAYGGGYGAASIRQMPKMVTPMRDQNIQQPFLPTLPIATQGYGQQPVTTDWSSP